MIALAAAVSIGVFFAVAIFLLTRHLHRRISELAAEHVPRLFERFYRVDKARSRESGGTGLGLAIVKHVAMLHGGTVSCESEVGCGSAFVLEVPCTLS